MNSDAVVAAARATFGSHVVATTVIPLLGWLIIIWNGSRLARRSEIRSLCTGLVSMIERIEQSARKEWLERSVLGRIEEESISSDINSLELRLNLLNSLSEEIDLSSELARLRHIATAELCISDKTSEERVRKQKISDIWHACSEITIRVESHYIRTFNSLITKIL